MPDLERFGRYEISQGSGGKPIELYRARGETICLAFDTARRCLVELHLLPQSTGFSAEERHSFFERLKLARTLRGNRGFSTVLRGDTVNGTMFYTANINDGEPVYEYVRRMGPIPAETALGLAVELSEKLCRLRGYQRFFATMSLTNAMLTVGDGGNLGLRAVDFGLGRREPRAEVYSDAALVREFAWLLLDMMTGQERPPDGEKGPRIKLGGLPITLRRLLKGLLTNSVTAPVKLQGLHDALEEALKSVQRSFLARNQRRHLIVSSRFYPKTTLERHLIPTPALPRQLSDRYHADERAFGPKDPFRLHLVDAENSDRTGMQILPPFRIISQRNYTPVPEQLDEADMSRFPHVMDVFEGWESDDAIYLAEENWPGFPLPYLQRIKGRFKVRETVVLLRHVVHALDQAAECGIEVRQLRPRDFQVCFPARTTQADLRALVERRIDVWPQFVMKIRTHAAIRALIQPESEIESAIVDLKQRQPELLKQRFLALAIEFLTGSTGELPRQNLPAGLFALFERCGGDIRDGAPLPEPADFVAQFAEILKNPPEEPAFSTYLWAGAPNGKVVEVERPQFPEAPRPVGPEPVAIGIKHRAFYKSELRDEESGEILPVPALEEQPAILWDEGQLEARYDRPLGLGEAMMAAMKAKDNGQSDEDAPAATPESAGDEAWPDENLAPPQFDVHVDDDNARRKPRTTIELRGTLKKVPKRRSLKERVASFAFHLVQVAIILAVPLFLFVGIPNIKTTEASEPAETTQPQSPSGQEMHQSVGRRETARVAEKT